MHTTVNIDGSGLLAPHVSLNKPAVTKRLSLHSFKCKVWASVR